MASAASATAIRPDLTERYLRLIGSGDEEAAVGLVLELLDEGRPAEPVLLEVIGAAQVEVGRRWAENRWSVAQEHAATAISERAVAAVASRVRVRPSRGRVAVACVDGEWHALPARILGEVLRLRGWRVDYLGASVPGPHLVTHLQQRDVDVVALSCMLPTRLPRAHAAITACRAAGVPVIAGGLGFGADGRHAARLGADAWAPRADAAADRLAGGDWPPAGGQEPPPAWLAGAEHTRLVQRQAALVDTALHRLAERYPPMAGYDQKQRDATAEDLGHILDFLAAALYVDDPAIFTEFVAWATGVLAARGVPAGALAAGLAVLGELLPDLPRAAAMVASGAAEVHGAERRLSLRSGLDKPTGGGHHQM